MDYSLPQLIKIALTLLKGKYFPSAYQRIKRKWYSEDGDSTYRLNYDLSDESIVFDLGGYKGQWASDIFAKYRPSVFVFEPVKSFADAIDKRFEKNERIKIFTLGLGQSSRDEEIHISDDGSSIFGKSKDKERIKIVDANDWIQQNLTPNQEIDLMKINIEGGEYELLDRLIESQLVNRVKNIQVQFHNISNDSAPHMEKIQSELKKTHKLTYQYRFVWENWQRK